MDKQISIKVPSFIDDPLVGRAIFPNGLRWHVSISIGIIIFLPNGFIYLFNHSLDKTYLLTSITMIFFITIFTVLYNSIIDIFFSDIIEINNGQLKYIYSKYSKKPERSFKINFISKFVLKKERYGNRNILCIADKSGNEEILIKEFRVGTWEKDWQRFLHLLNESTDKTIEVLEADF